MAYMTAATGATHGRGKIVWFYRIERLRPTAGLGGFNWYQDEAWGCTWRDDWTGVHWWWG